MREDSDGIHRVDGHAESGNLEPFPLKVQGGRGKDCPETHKEGPDYQILPRITSKPGPGGWQRGVV